MKLRAVPYVVPFFALALVGAGLSLLTMAALTGAQWCERRLK